VCTRQRLDDLLDDAALGLGGVLTGPLELTEQALDVLVVVLEQHEGVGRHAGGPFGKAAWRQPAAVW
jgi:hypothetical protein